MNRPRKSGQPHRGWKMALHKITSGPLRTATAYREIAKSALEAKDLSKNGQVISEEEQAEKIRAEDEREEALANGQFGVGA